MTILPILALVLIHTLPNPRSSQISKDHRSGQRAFGHRSSQRTKDHRAAEIAAAPHPSQPILPILVLVLIHTLPNPRSSQISKDHRSSQRASRHRSNQRTKDHRAAEIAAAPHPSQPPSQQPHQSQIARRWDPMECAHDPLPKTVEPSLNRSTLGPVNPVLLPPLNLAAPPTKPTAATTEPNTNPTEPTLNPAPEPTSNCTNLNRPPTAPTSSSTRPATHE
ncbi:hypothetical protein RIF29_22024 [Crotalaria pallida]|uniref:Uncharacterized protein n=1 Tax=Crotalaria pallida TaxID=3830 RepID=A0AAN9F5N4_CROPI